MQSPSLAWCPASFKDCTAALVRQIPGDMFPYPGIFSKTPSQRLIWRLVNHLDRGFRLHARRPQDRAVAKYELVHAVRSHIGADDDAFNAIRQREDEDGIRGILLQRNVVPTAALALKTNIASLAPLVLPFTELVGAPPSWQPFAAAVPESWLSNSQASGRMQLLTLVLPLVFITSGSQLQSHLRNCWTLEFLSLCSVLSENLRGDAHLLSCFVFSSALLLKYSSRPKTTTIV